MFIIKCTKMRRSKFIDRNLVFNITLDDFMHKIETSISIRPEFKKLAIAFSLNRVEIKFAVLNVDKSAPFARGTKREKTVELPDIRDHIKEFCDTRLDGYWTWKTQNKKRDADNIEVNLEMFFEHESDLELFLKNCGTIIKLAN